MKCNEINIRDPFILEENGRYYMYGTRAADFGYNVGGFDVYVSTDLENWSEPVPCFDSEQYGLNRAVNWAPEVHKYNGAYYMFATFMRETDLKGTFILRAEQPEGPFVPHSDGAVTPEDWQCLDGTLYVSKDNQPYVVFCHEWTQIQDGTICFSKLSADLKTVVGAPETLFAASECPWADAIRSSTYGQGWVTDGPYLYRNQADELMMIWSSFIDHKYAEMVVKFQNGELGHDFVHLPPLLDNDGGHGMIFQKEGHLYFTYHTPNTKGEERPAFLEIRETPSGLAIK